jgi:hypothetical protein
MRVTFAIVAASLLPATAWAQTDLVTTPPPNFVIGNYNSTAVGPYGGLEGSAYVARINDPSASWFNPAGLTRQGAPQISGSAGVYQHTGVAPEALPNEGGSIQQLPNFVGFTFVPRSGLTVGAAFLSTNAWAQQTDAELIAAGGQQRFAYAADSDFEQRVAAVGAGYHGGGPWRYGGGFAFSLMSLRIVQSGSDRSTDASTLRTLLIESHASASALQLRAQGGVQYDLARWRFGGSVRSPGLTLYTSATAVLDGAYASDADSAGASFFDTDAALEYHLPWEFQGGAAFVSDRFEFELDLHAYTPIDAYPLLSSTQPVRLYGDGGAGVPPVIGSRPFAGLTVAADGVVNVGAGGHYKLLQNRDWRLHAGVGANRSPVGPEDEVFTNVDLTTWSVGFSGSLGRFLFSAGLNRQSGTAENVALLSLLNGQQMTTPVAVRMSGFIYSLAYQF